MDSSTFTDVETANAPSGVSPSHGAGRRSQSLRATAVLVGMVVGVLGGTQQRRRDERGLSQSTENAILLAGAAAIALTIITVITAYVKQRLPK